VASFGVSRTPVRAALLQLEGLGLIRRHPRRGATVFLPTLAEFPAILEVHAKLEGRAPGLAARRLPVAGGVRRWSGRVSPARRMRRPGPTAILTGAVIWTGGFAHVSRWRPTMQCWSISSGPMHANAGPVAARASAIPGSLPHRPPTNAPSPG